MDNSSYVVPNIPGKEKIADALVSVKSNEGKRGLFQPAWKLRVLALTKTSKDRLLQLLIFKIKGTSLQLGEQIQLYATTVITVSDDADKFKFTLSNSPDYGFQCSSKQDRSNFISLIEEAISHIGVTVDQQASENDTKNIAPRPEPVTTENLSQAGSSGMPSASRPFPARNSTASFSSPLAASSTPLQARMQRRNTSGIGMGQDGFTPRTFNKPAGIVISESKNVSSSVPVPEAFSNSTSLTVTPLAAPASSSLSATAPSILSAPSSSGLLPASTAVSSTVTTSTISSQLQPQASLMPTVETMSMSPMAPISAPVEVPAAAGETLPNTATIMSPSAAPLDAPSTQQYIASSQQPLVSDHAVGSHTPVVQELSSSRSRLGNSNSMAVSGMVQCAEPARRQITKDTGRAVLLSANTLSTTIPAGANSPHFAAGRTLPHEASRSQEGGLVASDMMVISSAAGPSSQQKESVDLSLDAFHEMVHRHADVSHAHYPFGTLTTSVGSATTGGAALGLSANTPSVTVQPTGQPVGTSIILQNTTPPSNSQASFYGGESGGAYGQLLHLQNPYNPNGHDTATPTNVPIGPDGNSVFSSSATKSIKTLIVTDEAAENTEYSPLSPSALQSAPETTPVNDAPVAADVSTEEGDVPLLRREIRALLLVNKQLTDLYESQEKAMNEMTQENSLMILNSQRELHRSQQLITVGQQKEGELAEELAQLKEKCEHLNERFYALEEEKDNQDKIHESLLQDHSDLLVQTNMLQEQNNSGESVVCRTYKIQIEELTSLVAMMRDSGEQYQMALKTCQLNLDGAVAKVGEKDKEVDRLRDNALADSKTIESLTEQVKSAQDAMLSLENRIHKEVEEELLVENHLVEKLELEKKQLTQRNLQWEKDMCDSEENVKRLQNQIQEQDVYAAELKLELDALKHVSIQYTQLCEEVRLKDSQIVDSESKLQFLQTQLDTSTRTLQNVQVSHDKNILACRSVEEDKLMLEETLGKKLKQKEIEIENQKSEYKVLQQRLGVSKEFNQRMTDALEVATKDHQSDIQNHSKVTFDLQKALDVSKYSLKELEHQLSQLEVSSNNEIISLKRSVSELEAIQGENRETIQQQGRLLQSTQESLHESTQNQELAFRSKESYQQKFSDSEDGRKRDQIRHGEMTETLQDEVKGLRAQLLEQSTAFEERELEWGEKKSVYMAQVHSMSAAAAAQERSVKQLQDQVSELTSTTTEDRQLLETQLRHSTTENMDLLEKLKSAEQSVSIRAQEYRSEMNEKLKIEYEWKATSRQQASLLSQTQQQLEEILAERDDTKLKCSKLTSELEICETSIKELTVQLEELTSEKRNRTKLYNQNAHELQQLKDSLSQMEHRSEHAQRELDNLKLENVALESEYAEFKQQSGQKYEVAAVQKQSYFEGLLSEQTAAHQRALATIKEKHKLFVEEIQEEHSATLCETNKAHEEVVSSLKQHLHENECTTQEQYLSLQHRLESDCARMKDALACKEEQCDIKMQEVVTSSESKYKLLSNSHNMLLEKCQQLESEVEENMKVNREKQQSLQKLKRKSVTIDKNFQDQVSAVKILEDRCHALEAGVASANEALEQKQQLLDDVTGVKNTSVAQVEECQHKIHALETELSSVISENQMMDNLEEVRSDFTKQLTQQKLENAEIIEERNEMFGKVNSVLAILGTNNDFLLHLLAKLEDVPGSSGVEKQDVCWYSWDEAVSASKFVTVSNAQGWSVELSARTEELCEYTKRLFSWCASVSSQTENLLQLTQQSNKAIVDITSDGSVNCIIVSRLNEICSLYSKLRDENVAAIQKVSNMELEIGTCESKLEEASEILSMTERNFSCEATSYQDQLAVALMEKTASKKQHADELASLMNEYEGVIQTQDQRYRETQNALVTAQQELKSLTEKKTTIEQVHDNVVNDLIKKHDSQLHALQGSCNEFQLQIEEKEINQGKLQQQLEDAKNSEISHVEIYHKSEIEIGELRKQLEDYKSALKTKNSGLMECQSKLEKAELKAAREASSRLELQKLVRRAGLDKTANQKSSSENINDANSLSVSEVANGPILSNVDKVEKQTRHSVEPLQTLMPLMSQQHKDSKEKHGGQNSITISDLNVPGHVGPSGVNVSTIPPRTSVPVVATSSALFDTTAATNDGSNAHDSDRGRSNAGGMTPPTRDSVPRIRKFDQLHEHTPRRASAHAGTPAAMSGVRNNKLSTRASISEGSKLVPSDNIRPVNTTPTGSSPALALSVSTAQPSAKLDWAEATSCRIEKAIKDKGWKTNL